MSGNAIPIISKNTSSFFQSGFNLKKPALEPKFSSHNNPDATFFTSRASFEKRAEHKLCGFITQDQMQLLPDDTKNFLVKNTEFIQYLVKQGVIPVDFLSLRYNELMQLLAQRYNLTLLLDAGVSMQALLALDSKIRDIFINHADVIVTLLHEGNSFEALSTLCGDDLMHCVNQRQTAEVSHSSTPFSLG